MLKDSLKTIAVSLITLSLVGVVYAWTEPTQIPPLGNTAAPITTDATPQIKNGGLDLKSLTVQGGSLFNNGVSIAMPAGATIPPLSISSASEATDEILKLTRQSTTQQTTSFRQGTDGALVINSGGLDVVKIQNGNLSITTPSGGVVFPDQTVQSSALSFVTDTYVGDGVDNREILVGFTPDDVEVGTVASFISSPYSTVHRNRNMESGYSQFIDSANWTKNGIKSFTTATTTGTGGFTIGTIANVNEAGRTYWFKASRGGRSPITTPSITNFSANKTLIGTNHPFNDQPVIFSWNAIGASSCSASDGGASTTWSTNKPTSGSETIYPKSIDFGVNKIFRFSLTCSNIGGLFPATKFIDIEVIGWKRVAQTGYYTHKGKTCLDWLQSNSQTGVNNSSPYSNDTDGQGNAEINNRCMYAANQDVAWTGYPDGTSLGWTFWPGGNISVKSFAPDYSNIELWPIGEYNGGGGINWFGTYSRFK